MVLKLGFQWSLSLPQFLQVQPAKHKPIHNTIDAIDKNKRFCLLCFCQTKDFLLTQYNAHNAQHTHNTHTHTHTLSLSLSHMLPVATLEIFQQEVTTELHGLIEAPKADVKTVAHKLSQFISQKYGLERKLTSREGEGELFFVALLPFEALTLVFSQYYVLPFSRSFCKCLTRSITPSTQQLLTMIQRKFSPLSLVSSIPPKTHVRSHIDTSTHVDGHKHVYKYD